MARSRIFQDSDVQRLIPPQMILVAGANISITAEGQSQTIAASGSGMFSGGPNLVLATPNGSPGVASLRALVVADLPNPIDVGTF